MTWHAYKCNCCRPTKGTSSGKKKWLTCSRVRIERSLQVCFCFSSEKGFIQRGSPFFLRKNLRARKTLRNIVPWLKHKIKRYQDPYKDHWQNHLVWVSLWRIRDCVKPIGPNNRGSIPKAVMNDVSDPHNHDFRDANNNRRWLDCFRVILYTKYRM